MSERKIPRIRTIVPIAVIVTSTLGVGFYKYDQATRPVLLTGPMVHMPSADRLIVAWTAHPGGTTGWVELKHPDGRTTSQSVESTNGRYVVDFSGLQRGATYHYEIQNAGMFGRRVGLSGPHEYKTPAVRGTPFRFLAFGDSGVGGHAQAIVAGRMADEKPDLVIHVGDLIYPAGETQSYPSNFYEPNAALVRSTPFMPTLGNHDVATDKGAPLLDEFVLPRNGPSGIEAERNFHFEFGDALFVGLDTNPVTQGGAITFEEMEKVVAPWVRSVLSASDATWKFVYFHHPYYTGSQHTAEGAKYVKKAFARVLEECGVDAVFCGHNHLYERTAPIRDDKIDEERGIIYITTGAGGAQRYPEMSPPPPYIRHFNDKVFSFTRVDVSPERVVICQIDENGESLDRIELSKSRRAGSEEVKNSNPK